MEVFDETTGVEDGWGQDEKLDTGNSMQTPSGGSDTNGTSGPVPSAAQKDTQTRVIEGSQTAAYAYPTEGEETAPQWKVQGTPLEFASSTATREQHGPEQFTAPQYTFTSSDRTESVRLDIQTSGQYGQAGSSGRLASQSDRKATKDFRSGQDGVKLGGSAFKGDKSSGSELFHQAHHFVIQSSEFFSQKIIHNHSEPSANEVLSALENPIGTSWDPARACLPGTRADIIQDAVNWLSIVPTTGTAGLYVVTDGVGTGKSSLAHAVAGKVQRKGYLVASFFFNQLNTEISTTRHLFGALIRGLCSANKRAQDAAVKILLADSMLATAPPTRQFDELFLPISQALPHDRPLAIVIDALDEGFDEDLMKIFRDRIPDLPSNVRIMVTTRPEDRITTYLDPAEPSHIHHCPYRLSGDSSSNDVKQYIGYELRNGKKLALTPRLKTDFIQKSKGFFLWTAAVLKHVKRAHNPADELTQILEAGGTEWWKNDGDAGKRLDALFDRVIASLNSKDSKFVSSYTKVVGVLVTAKEPLSAEAIEKLLASEGVSLTDILDTLSQRAPHPFRLNVSDHHPVLCYAALKVVDQETNLDTFPFLGFSKDVESPHPSFDGNKIPQYLLYAYKFVIEHLVSSQQSDIQPACIDLLGDVLVSKGRELLETTAVMKCLLDVGRLRTWALEVFQDDQAPLHIIHAADGYFGEALHDIGRWLRNRDMPLARHGLAPLTTYTEMCRPLPAGGSRNRDLNKRLALSLNSLAECQMAVGGGNSCVVAIEEALPIWRGLDTTSSRIKRTHNRAKYKLERQDILRGLCHCLQMAEEYQEAVEAAKELVKITRQLTRKNPNLYEPHLAQNLVTLSKCLTKIEDHRSALAAAEESVQIHQRMFASYPTGAKTWLSDARFFFRHCLVNVEKDQAAAEAAEKLVEMDRRRTNRILNLYGRYLAKNLTGLSQCLAKVGDHGPAEEGPQIRRRLFASNPTDYEIKLSDALLVFHNCLVHAERHKEAVEAAKELVEVVRQLKSKDPNRHEKYLALNLRTLSSCLTKIEDHGPALAATRESLQIYRRLFASNPTEYDIALADALWTFRDCLVHAEKHQEAAEAAKELVEMDRQLTAKSPNRYESYLALNLRTLSECLTKVEDHGPALAAAQESLQIYRPLFASNPTDYEIKLSNALFFFRDCLVHAEKHQEAAEVAKELVETARQLTAKNPNLNLYESYLALNLKTLSECLTKVEDHGPALAAAQESLQIYHRLFANNPAGYDIALGNALWTFRDCLIHTEKHQEAAEAAMEQVQMQRQLSAENPNLYESYLALNLKTLSKCLMKVEDHRLALAAVQESLQIYRRLFASNPTDYEIDLSDTVFTFRDCLVNAGKNQEAAEAAKELVKMNRQFASEDPTGWEEPFARSLIVLSKCLTKVDDLPAALVTVQEAVALYRKLSCQNEAKRRAALDGSLAWQDKILSQPQGDSKESAEAIPEVDVETEPSAQA